MNTPADQDINRLTWCNVVQNQCLVLIHNNKHVVFRLNEIIQFLKIQSI